MYHDREFFDDIIINCTRVHPKAHRFINGKDSRVISTLVLNVTLPSVVIVNLNHVNLTPSLVVLPVMMILYGVVTKVLIVLMFIKYSNEVRGTVAMMMAALNIGIFGFFVNVGW